MKNEKLPRKGTQKRIILEALLESVGDWVELNFLMRIARSAAVHSVVSDLRSYGWIIENKMLKTEEEERKHSFYRIPIDSVTGESKTS